MSSARDAATLALGVSAQDAGRGEVRPIEPRDMPAAAALFKRAMAADSSLEGVERLLRAAALEDPWTDPALPTFVLVGDDGAIAGLLLNCTRRLRYEGRTLRATCGSQVIVDPAIRGRALGTTLIRHSMSQPKDFSYTDGAPDRARGMLERVGFVLLQLESLEWTSVLRPLAYWQGRLLPASRTHPLGRLGHRLAKPLDRILGRTPFAPAVRAPGLTREPLTPALMMEHLERLTSWAKLRVDYDLPFLTWLFAQLSDDHPQGELAAQLVRRDGAAIGWHISLVKRGGIAQSMQVVAAPEDAPAVFASMLVHARERGAVAARGRLEAPLVPAITTRRTVLRRTSYALVRAKDAELISTLQNGAALFTRLDADWWIDPSGR